MAPPKEFPIKLGSILFTMVEPHKGHEVEYNRWYERDHFYAGCMVGKWTFAGQRFASLVAVNPPQFYENRFAIKFTYSWRP